MPTSLNRRTALTAIAAVPAVSLPALAAAAEPHPDAELIELGRQFNDLEAQGERANELSRPHYEALERMMTDAMERAGGGSIPDEEWEAIRARINAEFPRPRPTYEDIAKLMEPIECRIMALPAATVAGLAVKARVAEVYCSGLGWGDFDHDLKLTWDHEVARNLIEAVLALAEA